MAAFEAAEFLMDYLKSNAPFWKKELLAEGAEGDWVDTKPEDEHALARW
jgi:molybdopterin synthase catalytic subunit